MDRSVIDQMKAEEISLLRKLEAVRAVLAVYGDETPKAEAPSPKPHPQAPNGVPRQGKQGKVSLSRFSPYGADIVRASMRCIATQAVRPVRTRNLVGLIETSGVTIRGEDKVNSLGALLARSEDLVGHGKRGWTLASESSEFGGNASDENEASPGYAEDASDPGTQDGGSSESSPSNPSPNGSTS